MKRDDQLEALFSELREQCESAWKSFGFPAEVTSRLRIEVRSALGDLRRVVAGSAHLPEADFAKLLSVIREEFRAQLQQFQSEAAARVATDEAECSAIRKDIQRVEAERRAFNSRPDVIEVRQKGEKLNRQITTLQDEIALCRKLESMLLIRCEKLGIDPNSPVQSAGSSDNVVATAVAGRAGIVARLETETDPLKRGEIANELREHDAQHRGNAQ
jgi:hypothetical protein